MGRSPAISAGDYERPFGVCPAAKNSSLSQSALLHPEAIRDVLAPHAAVTYYCLELLPLLNPPESLSLIEEWWDTATMTSVALSVRCVTAAITAFIIAPPVSIHEKFVPPGVRFIGR